MNPSGEDTMNNIKATIVAVACGNAFSIALASDGRVFGFGYNSFGQLGNGTTTLAPEPVQMQAPDGVVAVACGHDHSVLLLGDGSVWTCGRNQAGQLGHGNLQNLHVPTRVEGLKQEGLSAHVVVDTISCGNIHTTVSTLDGTVYGFGWNKNKQLGSGVEGDIQHTPIKLEATGVVGKGSPETMVSLILPLDVGGSGSGGGGGATADAHVGDGAEGAAVSAGAGDAPSGSRKTGGRQANLKARLEAMAARLQLEESALAEIKSDPVNYTKKKEIRRRSAEAAEGEEAAVAIQSKWNALSDAEGTEPDDGIIASKRAEFVVKVMPGEGNDRGYGFTFGYGEGDAIVVNQVSHSIKCASHPPKEGDEVLAIGITQVSSIEAAEEAVRAASKTLSVLDMKVARRTFHPLGSASSAGGEDGSGRQRRSTYVVDNAAASDGRATPGDSGSDEDAANADGAHGRAAEYEEPTMASKRAEFVVTVEIGDGGFGVDFGNADDGVTVVVTAVSDSIKSSFPPQVGDELLEIAGNAATSLEIAELLLDAGSTAISLKLARTFSTAKGNAADAASPDRSLSEAVMTELVAEVAAEQSADEAATIVVELATERVVEQAVAAGYGGDDTAAVAPKSEEVREETAWLQRLRDENGALLDKLEHLHSSMLDRGGSEAAAAAAAAIPAQVEHIKSVYEHCAAAPAFVSASFLLGADGGPSVVATATQQDLVAGKTDIWQQTYSKAAASQSFEASFPGSLPEGSKVSRSPSGRKMAIFRSEGGDGGADAKQSVEIWSRAKLVRRVVATGVHGAVYAAGSQFGAMEWSADETRLLYAAESIAKKGSTWWASDKAAAGTTRGAKFEWHENWGEQLMGSVLPRLFVLDAVSKTATPVAVVGDDMEGWSAGQAVWAPCGDQIIYTGWPHENKMLGLIYCMNRKSALFSVAAPATVEGAGGTASASLSVLIAGDADFNARAPSFSPAGTTLVWLSSKVGGPHGSGTRLLASAIPAAWSSKDALENPAIVVELSHDERKPGLVALRLPSACWVSETALVTSTILRSLVVPAVIDVPSKSLEYVGNVMPSRKSMGGSWTVLSATPRGRNGWPAMVLAVVSSPSLLPTLMLGVQDTTRDPSRFLMSWEALTTQESVAASVKFDVLEIQGSPVNFEAILIEPVGTAPAGGFPLVVMPHGGPHSAHNTRFMSYNTGLVLLGYGVLAINYRGSIGFGEEGVHSLPGRCGELDTGDCRTALDCALATGRFNADQLVVQGGSHGGFLTAHLTAQYPDLFKAAVIRNPVINIPSMAMVTDIPDWCYHEAGLPYSTKASTAGLNAIEFEKMRACSPIALVDNVKTPALLNIGSLDKRVPPPQGWEWYYALKSRGVPTRVHEYPNDSHQLGGVDCAADVFVNMVVWFQMFGC